jgi:hypothetical protein
VTMPDLEPFRTAQRLEWHAWTVFDGDDPDGDGQMDGDLRAINGNEVAAHVPLDIFSPEALEDGTCTLGSGPWYLGQDAPVGIIVANPSTRDQVGEEIRRWCRQEIGRDDVTLTL